MRHEGRDARDFSDVTLVSEDSVRFEGRPCVLEFRSYLLVVRMRSLAKPGGQPALPHQHTLALSQRELVEDVVDRLPLPRPREERNDRQNESRPPDASQPQLSCSRLQ